MFGWFKRWFQVAPKRHVVTVLKGDGWKDARHPGDDLIAPFDFQYLEFDGRDRIVVTGWEREQVQNWDELQEPGNLERWSLEVESRAMAVRLRMPNRDQFTERMLLDIHGRSPPAWVWLSRLLYEPIHLEAESAVRRSKLRKRFGWQQQLEALEAQALLLRYEIAATA